MRAHVRVCVWAHAHVCVCVCLCVCVCACVCVFPYNVLLYEQIVQINFYKLVSKLTFPTCQQHECDDLAVNLISNMWTFSTSTAIII